MASDHEDVEMDDNFDGLIEKDGRLYQFKRGKQRGQHVSNFTIVVIGTYRNSISLKPLGYVINVTRDDGTTWQVHASHSEFSDGDSALKALQTRENRVFFNKHKARPELVDYCRAKMVSHMQLESDPKYIVITNTGCVKVNTKIKNSNEIESKYFYVMPNNAGGLTVISHKGNIRKENGPDATTQFLLKVDSNMPECLKDEQKLLKSIIPQMLEHTPPQNRPPFVVEAGWLMGALQNLADKTVINPLCNKFGKPCSGKSTATYFLHRLVGCEELIKAYSYNELRHQSTVSSCPATLDDPLPKGNEFEKFHSTAVQIAEKKARQVNKRSKDTVDPVPIGSAVIISNLENFSYYKHHGLLSRAVCLEVLEVDQASKNRFDEFRHALMEQTEGKTCFAEFIKIRHLYGSSGHRGEIGADLENRVSNELVEIFRECQSRAIDTYRLPIKYTCWLLHYINQEYLIEDVFTYLRNRASRFHRFPNVQDVINKFLLSFRHNWKTINKQSCHHAIRQTLIVPKAGGCPIYLSKKSVEKIMPGFGDEIMAVASNDDETQSVFDATTRNWFLKGDVQDSTVIRTKANGGKLFSYVACYKIPIKYVPKELLKFVQGIEEGTRDNNSEGSGDENGEQLEQSSTRSPQPSTSNRTATPAITPTTAAVARLDIDSSPNATLTPVASSTPIVKEATPRRVLRNRPGRVAKQPKSLDT